MSNISVIRCVCGMGNGETWIIREAHLPRGRFHRYRDGWHFFQEISDRAGIARALIGYSFTDPQDVADFLSGELGARINNFALVGERIEP